MTRLIPPGVSDRAIGGLLPEVLPRLRAVLDRVGVVHMT
jgi:hypothetical protein